MTDYRVQAAAKSHRPEPQRSRNEKALDRIRQARGPGRLRVEPANDLMREHLKHPSHARHGGFQAEWPDDTFTHRRLRDGDIKLAADQRR